MAGRGRGIVVGRGRGKPKTQDVQPLSDEDKKRLIEGMSWLNEYRVLLGVNLFIGVSKIATTKVEPGNVPGQFADSKDDNNGESDISITKTTDYTPEPNDDSKTQLVKVNETSSQNTPPKPSVNDSHPSNGYHDASLGGRSKSSPATLNPNSSEFVPSSKFGRNVMAKEFIPTSYYPPPLPLEEETPPPSDDMVTTLDILEGFERRSPIDDPILVEVADMLIMTTIYPGMYDQRLQEFSETIKLTPPTDDMVLQDIGEMLIQWVSMWWAWSLCGGCGHCDKWIYM